MSSNLLIRSSLADSKEQIPFTFSSLYFLGGRVDRVTSNEAIEYIGQHIHSKKFLQVITANALMLLESNRDLLLMDVFRKSALVLPDSIGITLVSNLKGFHLPERIPGVDFIEKICKEALKKGWTLYLHGSKPGVAELASKKLKIRYPGLNIVGFSNGYLKDHEEKEVLEKIQSLKPNLLLVGLPVPGQEKWIDQNKKYFSDSTVMGVGGSFDVISGLLKRAPKWVQSIGLEWLFRLFQEPWRWKRIIHLPIFFYKALRSKHRILHP